MKFVVLNKSLQTASGSASNSIISKSYEHSKIYWYFQMYQNKKRLTYEKSAMSDFTHISATNALPIVFIVILLILTSL